MCLRDQIFRVLLGHFISAWSCAQMTVGSNVFGSFGAFCYKFCGQVTTGANVWRVLVYHIINFVQKLLGKQLLYFY